MQNKENNKGNDEGCCSSHASFPQIDFKEMQNMMECMSVCAACAKKCVDEGQKKTAALCAECADICSLAIKAKSSQSEFQHQIMDLCAKICKRCAEECKKMKVDHCQECAEVCTRCSESCSPAHSPH